MSMKITWQGSPAILKPFSRTPACTNPIELQHVSLYCATACVVWGKKGANSNGEPKHSKLTRRYGYQHGFAFIRLCSYLLAAASRWYWINADSPHATRPATRSIADRTAVNAGTAGMRELENYAAAVG